MRRSLLSSAFLLLAIRARAFAPQTLAPEARTKAMPRCSLATSAGQADMYQFNDIGNADIRKELTHYSDSIVGKRAKMLDGGHNGVYMVDSAMDLPTMAKADDRYEMRPSVGGQQDREIIQAVDYELDRHSNEVVDQPIKPIDNRSYRYEGLMRVSDGIADQPGIWPKIVGEDRQEPNLMEDVKESDQVRAIAAGVGTGVLGMLACGPVGAAMLGFSAAFAAEKENGVVGDSARAFGDVALSARAKASEIEDKHHVSQKAAVVAAEAWEKAKELDREHKIIQKAKDVAIYGSSATVSFVHRHNLVGRGLDGIGKSVCWINERVSSGSLSPDEGTGKDISHETVEMAAYRRIDPAERNMYKRIIE
eukprot:CAMPEP_0113594538 /NCGR_PEP_ID=MMETSP0015_2-20120614/39140_1 /TAXON_ID=2838 /ORGANISM="Odontella" /LENGTH=363 /DNA_ID=CAMNT_0000501561 /DNA_START=128 /DNA_END=1220 /DNA_ORIENTATION=+ /assembly_acc=CAM_ASM_000160